MFICFIFPKNEKVPWEGLKHLLFYKVPTRVGWHAMGLVANSNPRPQAK